MEQSQLNWIVGYIWGIADDVLRGVVEVSGQATDAVFGLTYERRGA